MAIRKNAVEPTEPVVPVEAEPDNFERQVPDFLEQIPGIPSDQPDNLFNWENPHPTKTQARVDVMAPMATCAVPGAVQWYVERLDMESGRDSFTGMIHIQASHPEFIRRFYKSMPATPSTSTTFFLWPTDAKGTRLGASREPYANVTISYENVILEGIRKEQAQAQVAQPGVLGGPATSDAIVLKLLTDTIESLKAERADAVRRADEAAARAEQQREALMEQRLSTSTQMVGEMSTVFQQTNKMQTDAAVSTLEAQREAARVQRELDAEDRRARREEEKAAREEERRLRQEEMTLKIKAMEIDAELKKAAMALEAEQLRQRAQEERDRISQERIDAENRRREERDAERDRRAAEDQARREHEERLETMRIRAEERDADRAREHRESQQQLFNATLALAAQREEREQGHKLGILGEILDLTGMTPMTLLEKGKEMIAEMSGGGTGGLAGTIVQAVADISKEVIKRLPNPEDDDDDEDEDEEDEEDGEGEETPEASAEAPPKPRRQLAGGISAALATGEPLALPAPVDAPAAAPQAERVLVPVAPTVPLAELRAGRSAVEAAVKAVSGRLPSEWPQLLAEVVASTPLVAYLRRVGTVKAMEEMTLDRAAAENLAQALERMGNPVPLEVA